MQAVRGYRQIAAQGPNNPMAGFSKRYPQQGFCCWIGGHGTLP
jgi:hypothetical protein